MRIPWWLGLLVCATAGAAPDDDQLVDANLPAPPTDTVKPGPRPSLPPVPLFDGGVPNADGTRTPKELRVRGKKLLDSEVTVRGVVTWVYDCPSAIRGPRETDKAARARIDADPTLCERAKLYLGDTAATPAERSIWVVDLPRVYNKLELARIKKAERTAPDRCEPGDTKSVCGPYKVGDEIIVTGTWKLTSPHAERNSDGLLVYRDMKNVTARWESPGTAHVTKPLPPVPAPRAPTTVSPASTAKVAIPKVKASVRRASVAAKSEGTRALAQKQVETAIERYTMATTKWPDNHLAWYELSMAFGRKDDWARAADAAARAVALAPDIAMYHQQYGYTLYEKGSDQARADQAARAGRKPDEITVDLSAVNFDKASAHVSAALQLNPDLWMAHYTASLIADAGDHPKLAADELTRAIGLGQSYAGPWIALAKLYRAWDYTDQAILVAEQAITFVADRYRIYYELGAAYDDKRLDDKAIEAFTKALDLEPDSGKTKFARGQIWFRKREYAKAKLDLEDFVARVGAVPAFYIQQANRMLMDIAAAKGR